MDCDKSYTVAYFLTKSCVMSGARVAGHPTGVLSSGRRALTQPQAKEVSTERLIIKHTFCVGLYLVYTLVYEPPVPRGCAI